MKTHIVTSVLLNDRIEESYNQYREIHSKELINSEHINGNYFHDYEVLEKVIKIDSFISTYDLLIEKQKFLNKTFIDPELELKFDYLKGLENSMHKHQN